MNALRATLVGHDRSQPDGHMDRRAQTGALLPVFLILIAAVSPASAPTRNTQEQSRKKS